MKKRILAKNILEYMGQSITLCGWVHRIRELGGVSFVLLRDRSGIAQIVFPNGKIAIKGESIIEVSGMVVKSEKAPYGAELQKETIKTISEPQEDLPLSINAPMNSIGIETLLEQRLLSLRIPKMRALFEVQSEILRCFSSYLRARDFTEIKTSKLIGSGTEGGTGLFEVSYFNTKVYLAQSPQFYKQAGIASGLERVFEVGHVYRAEKHETNRHINEYVSLDIEMAFIENEHDLMDIQQEFLQETSEHLNSNCQEQIALWKAQIPFPNALEKIPRVSYDEAKKIVSERSKVRVLDIDPNAERELCVWAEENYNVPAVFVLEFPRRKRPFYTMPNGQKTKGFDLIFGGVEISTGGLRIHDYKMLCENAKRFLLDSKKMQDYFSIFKYGCPPHGGWAIGLERLTQKILGCDNVKLASMFPRDRMRITP